MRFYDLNYLDVVDEKPTFKSLVKGSRLNQFLISFGFFSVEPESN
jgi:hypothetical protein